MTRRHAMRLTACFEDWIPGDSDVSLDNSNTRKENVSYTYKGMDGYAPNFAYLGQERIHGQPRVAAWLATPPTRHAGVLDETLKLVRRIAQAKLLVRMNSGNDDVENVRMLRR